MTKFSGILISNILIFLSAFILINCEKDKTDITPISEEIEEDPTDFPTKLVEVENSNQYEYDVKDNKGYSMDCVKIIQGENGNFLSVYHSYIDGVARIFLATSKDLFDWTNQKELAYNASQPTIAVSKEGGYVLAWEQEPNNHLRFIYCKTTEDLINGVFSKDFEAERQLSLCAEGTPNIYAASLSRVEVGFHYFNNCDVDRQSKGTLLNFNSWITESQPQIDRAFLPFGIQGNIGDRDFIRINENDYSIIEAQKRKGDFGTWRSYVYDHEKEKAFKLEVKTHKGSLNFANPTISELTFNGEKILLMTFFIPSENAKPGEAGELIFYRKMSENIYPK